MLRHVGKVLTLVGFAALFANGCSSDSSPTSPNGGGGGGGGVEFSSPTLNQNDSFEHVFMTAKTMNYYCSFHGTATTGMHATITVTAGGTPHLVQSNIVASALETLNIHVGDTVRWTNQTPMQHNVRSAS